jgi:hypothetical protein
MSSPTLPDHHPSPMGSNLTKILAGTAFQWEAEKSAVFNEWWETTPWANKLRENLEKEIMLRSKQISSPRWDSKLRTAAHWAQYRQGAKISSGEPFIFCISCNAPLHHPSAFNLGTTHMKNHLTSGKCRATSGRKDEDISRMFGKVTNHILNLCHLLRMKLTPITTRQYVGKLHQPPHNLVIIYSDKSSPKR